MVKAPRSICSVSVGPIRRHVPVPHDDSGHYPKAVVIGAVLEFLIAKSVRSPFIVIGFHLRLCRNEWGFTAQ